MLYADTTLKQVYIDGEDISGLTVSDFTGSIFMPTISWGESYLRVSNISSTKISGNDAYGIKFNSADNYFFTRSMKIHPRASYHFENSEAFLDSCGEWFYNETAKKLYYIPYDYETLDNTVLRIPVTQTLVEVGGSVDSKTANVVFDGVAFAYTANGVDGKIGGQANINHSESVNQDGIQAGRPSAAVTANNINGVSFKNNLFYCTANGALDFASGVSNAEITENVFKHIGGNGIFVGASITDASVYLKEYNENSQIGVSNVTVEGNYITDIGWQEYSAVGVILTFVKTATVKNNTISGSNYSGISAGWGWQTLAASSEVLGDIHITSNKITNVCRTMNDGGAIYLAGCMPDSTVTGNYIKDIYNYVYRYPLDKTTSYADYTQIWWANVGIYLDTAAGSDDQNNPLVIANNYIADDIQNQKYEFCNTELYFTIDGKTKDNLTINEANAVSEQSVLNAGVTNSSLASAVALYGSRTVSTTQITLYGNNLLNANIYIDGKLLQESYITEKTNNKITFNSSFLTDGGHTVTASDSKTFITAGVDSTYDGITRFDNKYGGYTELAKLGVSKKTLTNFESSSALVGYTADKIADGYEYTGWSMDMSADNGDGAWVSFELKSTSKISYFIIYERAGGGFDATNAKNFKVLGYNLLGQEIELYSTDETLAFDNGGMLVLDISALGYSSTYFKSFKIQKTVADEYFFVAEVAVI